jgi:Ca2+-binding EF-hand superfamily protein
MESREEVLARTRRRINAAKSRKGRSWQDVFGKCDKDGSGFLDYTEFSEAVRSSLNVPENAICDYELRTLFNEMDADRSGGVNIEELLMYLAQGSRTPEEIAARAQVRIQRVRKNLKAAFQTVASNEMSIRKLFSQLDMDADCSLSLYEFRTFVRMNLKLSFWDISNTDIDDFYKFLDRDGRGISVDELITFVRQNNAERPKDFSFQDMKKDSSTDSLRRRQLKKKTYKQQLLEDSFRSTSTPNLSRLPYTPSVVSLGRNYAPTTRNVISMSAKMFFSPGKTH